MSQEVLNNSDPKDANQGSDQHQQVTSSDASADLQRQKAETAEQLRRQAEAQAEAARLQAENERIQYTESLKQAVSAAIAGCGLQAYSEPAVIKMLEAGAGGALEVRRNRDGQPTAFIDGREVNWAEAISKFATIHRTWFRDGSLKPQISPELQAEIDSKMGNHTTRDDGEILSWADFKSREHKMRWMAENPGKAQTLPPTRDHLLANRDPLKMTRAELNQLNADEKAKIISKIGFAKWEALVGRR